MASTHPTLAAPTRPVLWLDRFATAIWLIALVALFAAPRLLPMANVGDFLIRNTIRLSLAYWAAAVALWTWLRPADWRNLPRVSLTRCCWSLAWAAFVVHSLVAWHYYHHWSHAHAVAHTEQVSGAGWGIYVTYVFTLVWALDAAAWWLWPDGHATRPTWLSAALHSFLTFILFCGTVVYEGGPIRWIGAVGFAMLGVSWLAAKLRPSPSS